MKTSFALKTSFLLAVVGTACGNQAGPSPLSYEEFKAQAYHDPETGTYVVNGDELVADEQAMHDAYDAFLASVDDAGATPGYATARQGLIVNRVAGHDDVWSAGNATELTYCVSRASFGTRYDQVVRAMSDAASEWQAASTVRFKHVTSADASCGNATGTVFDVRQVTGQPFLARSFFPSNARADREVLIDATAYNALPETLTGILRHELGHTLGFRHEHTRPEAGTCFEDNNWRALTAYDSASVMHYPQCNGSNHGDLVLTALDKQGAFGLYPVQKASFTKTTQLFPGLDFGLPSPWQAITGDFDGDGKTDYAELGDTGAFIYYGTADAGFAKQFQNYQGLAFGLPSQWQTITGDFDGDGRADYARLGDTGAFFYYGTTVQGVFNKQFHNYQSLGLAFGLPSQWQAITGDFDGDGKTDYARLGDTGAFVFYGTATQGVFNKQFQNYQSLGLAFGLPSQWKPITGDFDGDGKTDYARIGDTGAFVFYGTATQGVFNKQFHNYQSQGLAFGLPTQWQVITGDFDGDGRTDYAFLGDTGAFAFYGTATQGVFNKQFQNYQAQGLAFGLPSQWQVVTGDFNNDGKTDYARLGDTGAFWYYGAGGETVVPDFQDYKGLGFGLPSQWQLVAGNFTGSGKTSYGRIGGTVAFVYVP